MERSTSTFFFVVLIMIMKTCSLAKTVTQPKIPAILIFGDSTVDTGNNNFIATLFKANFYPYGQDFPGHIPTGRFSNGKLIPDLVASFLGIKQTVPPFLDPTLTDQDLQTGVCFASAGTGYDNLTATIGNVIPMSKQLDYFKSYIAKLEGIVGETKAKHIIKKALVIISAGTNDFGINYHIFPTRAQQFGGRAQFGIGAYQDFVQKELEHFVKGLYRLGCRKFMVAGLPPMGCLPILKTGRLLFPPFAPTCLDDENAHARSYNKKLIKLLPRLQTSLSGSTIVYADVYTPMIDIANNPKKYGFTVTDRGCCGTGLVEATFLCNLFSLQCPAHSHSQFIFWDSIHPTEATYKVLVEFLKEELIKRFT